MAKKMVTLHSKNPNVVRPQKKWLVSPPTNLIRWDQKKPNGAEFSMSQVW
jgi:hypothetical protein